MLKVKCEFEKSPKDKPCDFIRMGWAGVAGRTSGFTGQEILVDEPVDDLTDYKSTLHCATKLPIQHSSYFTGSRFYTL